MSGRKKREKKINSNNFLCRAIFLLQTAKRTFALFLQCAQASNLWGMKNLIYYASHVWEPLRPHKKTIYRGDGERVMKLSQVLPSHAAKITWSSVQLSLVAVF